MAREPFKGTINLDIRDSVPDWAPFEPPKAPDGSPNVLYIVLDDVGYSAMSCYGGPVETPNIDKIAASGVRFTQWHTTALCSPTRSCLLTGRNHTRNSRACITEAAVGFPDASGTIPPQNGMVSETLGDLGWNTYLVGKWHLCPTVEMNLAATRRNWPTGRGFERFYGFLGAETNQWFPELIYDNHPVDQPETPERGYHFNEDSWELYHTDTDRAELHDLAAEHPDKLRWLINLWFAEAGANGAFPLDDRSAVEIPTTPRPRLASPRDRYIYYPGVADVPEVQAVNVHNRSFTIGAQVDIPAPGAERGPLRARSTVRRPRAVHQRQPAAPSSGSPSTSAANRTWTWSARRKPCLPASRRMNEPCQAREAPVRPAPRRAVGRRPRSA